jgi:predicted metal-dependent hydrolase
MKTITIGEQTIAYRVRRSARARRLALRVGADIGVEVVLPDRSPGGDVERFLLRHVRWIIRHQQNLARWKTLGDGTRLTVLGRDVTLRFEPCDGHRAVASLQGPSLTVRCREFDQELVRTLVLRVLTRVAREAIPRRVAAIDAGHSCGPAAVTIRNQRTRWGSCSRKGTLSFNWRLVLLPPFVMDYLIVHELAHLKEMSHSPRYWSRVGRMDPCGREAARWLRVNGRTLPL